VRCDGEQLFPPLTAAPGQSRRQQTRLERRQRQWRAPLRSNKFAARIGAEVSCQKPLGADIVGIAMIVTDTEFWLRLAKALLPTQPQRAATFVSRVVGETVDPRLRNLVSATSSMIERGDFEAAHRWLDRALEYERSRRAGRRLAS